MFVKSQYGELVNMDKMLGIKIEPNPHNHCAEIQDDYVLIGYLANDLNDPSNQICLGKGKLSLVSEFMFHIQKGLEENKQIVDLKARASYE